MASVPVTELQGTADRLAAIYGVHSALHPEDHMLGHFLTWGNPEGAVRHYFQGGSADAEQLMTSIEKLGVPMKPIRVLEFASGYGRLTRHLANRCNLSVCDIHPEAVEFVRKHSGCTAYLSSSNPDELKISEQFDVVAVISLFSHLPDRTFGRWLAAVYRLVAPGGHLLFTTIGDAGRETNPDVPVPGPDGYHFRPDSEQIDIDIAEYGNTTVRPNYVGFQIGKWIPTCKPISFDPAAWWKFQDQYIVQKPHDAVG